MTKRLLVITMLLITIFTLVGVSACSQNKEGNMSTITYELGNKTTDYFDVDDRRQLLKMVKSADELAQLIEEEQFSISPIYGDSFFETKTLVLYFFTSNQYNDLTLEVTATKKILEIYLKYDMPNGIAMEAERNWAFFIEIAYEDVSEISDVQIK